jgi:2-polyprenyl-3-methyl-5-hydroxy-6-metoxy-1,4-benzoquinol methylase
MNNYCKLCGGDKDLLLKYKAKAHFYNSEKEFHYYFCGNCDLLWRDQDQLISVGQYDDSYYSFQSSNSFINRLRYFIISLRFNLAYYFRIEVFSKGEYPLFFLIRKMNLPKDSYILDVGCGGGEFVRRMISYGYKNSYGIDPYISINKLGGLKIRPLSIENIEEKYDLINAHHVIEHTNNPQDFLHEIYRCLNPDGKAIITFPRYGKVLEYSGAYSYLLQAPDHNFLISPKSFSAFCKNANLKIIDIKIDGSGTFNWLLVSELWRKGINKKSYSAECLKFFSKFEIENLRNIASSFEESGHGANIIYIISRK